MLYGRKFKIKGAKMTKTQTKSFELSYYICPIGWNGKEVTFDPVQAENEFKNLHAAGIKWAGMNGVNLAEKINFDLGAAIELIKGWMKKYDIRFSSFHFSGATSAGVGKSQDMVRENILKSVEIFSRLQPKAFVVHAGWFHANDCGNIVKAWYQEKQKYGEEKIIGIIAENLKIMAQALGKYNIYLAIENMGKFLPLGQKENIALLIDLIDEPNVGYCLDTGHAHCVGESVVEWIKHCGDKLFETHFHDNRALAKNCKENFIATEGVDEHLSPGFGTIPWIDVIEALKLIDFKGPVTFETGGWPDANPVRGYRNAIAWWRTSECLASSLPKRKL